MIVLENLKGWRPSCGRKRSSLRQRFHGWLHRKLVKILGEMAFLNASYYNIGARYWINRLTGGNGRKASGQKFPECTEDSGHALVLVAYRTSLWSVKPHPHSVRNWVGRVHAAKNGMSIRELRRRIQQVKQVKSGSTPAEAYRQVIRKINRWAIPKEHEEEIRKLLDRLVELVELS